MDNKEIVGWLEKLDGKLDTISEKLSSSNIVQAEHSLKIQTLENNQKEKKSNLRSNIALVITSTISFCALIISGLMFWKQ